MPVQFAANRFRGKAAALDYSGTLSNREAGFAIIDHTSNLNAPSPWYVINEPVMHYFSPAVICYKVHTLKAGQSMTLRYRVVVHPGRWSAAQLNTESVRFGKN